MFDKKTDAIAVDDNQIDFGHIKWIDGLLSSTDSDANEKVDQETVKWLKVIQKNSSKRRI